MKTKDIPEDDWIDFFDNFSRQYQGWLVTLEILGSEIGAQVEGRDLTLEGITVDQDKEAGSAISIMTGAAPDDHITHNINRPTTVSLEQNEEGADAALAIKSADGTTALLRFRSPMLPEWVDGVVTGPSHRVF